MVKDEFAVEPMVVRLEVADNTCVHWLDPRCEVWRQVINLDVGSLGGIVLVGAGIVTQQKNTTALQFHSCVDPFKIPV